MLLVFSIGRLRSKEKMAAKALVVWWGLFVSDGVGERLFCYRVLCVKTLFEKEKRWGVRPTVHFAGGEGACCC